MEDSASPTSANDNWAEKFAHSLETQRGQVEQFLAAQRERLDQAQADLAEHARRISEKLGQDRLETVRGRREIDNRSEELTRQAENLDRLKQQLDAGQAEWNDSQERASEHFNTRAEQLRCQQEELNRRQQELEQRRKEIDSTEEKLSGDQRSFAIARQEHEAEVEHVAALRKRYEEQVAELGRQREQLAGDRTYTESQRRRIAKEFRSRHAAHFREIKRLRDELKQLPAKRPDDSGQPSDGIQENDAQLEELESLRSQRDTLSDRLADAERQLADPNGKPKTADQGNEDLRRRHEMALDDVRELKAKNAELEKELSRPRPASGPSESPSGGAMDWEAQKQRMLAALENDFDDENEADKADRLKIDEVIKTTDRILAAKDQEIADLKQLLSDQSSNLDGVAVGAAALGEMFDKDEIIREERESVRRLKQEWEEKLRQAEVDLSVERAKIARERSKIEEKLRTLNEMNEAEANSVKSGASDKPTRGRWLVRLGLKESDEE